MGLLSYCYMLFSSPRRIDDYLYCSLVGLPARSPVVLSTGYMLVYSYGLFVFLSNFYISLISYNPYVMCGVGGNTSIEVLRTLAGVEI